MKRFYLFIFLLFAAIPALAQTSDLDVYPLPFLRRKLAESKSDVNKIQLQLALGQLMLLKPDVDKKDIDSSLNFATEAAKLSHQLNYNVGIINSMLLTAQDFNKRNKPEIGFKIAQQALAFSQKINNDDGMGRSYIVLGQHYDVYSPDGLLKRMDYYSKAIAVFKKEQNVSWLANTLTHQAELFFLAEQNKEALKLLFETLNLGGTVPQRTIEGIYWTIGRTSIELGDYPNALKYNLLAIKTANEVEDTSLQRCSINQSIANVYVNMEDYHRAIPYSLLALKIARHYKNGDYIGTVAILLATEYSRTHRLDNALALLEETKEYYTNDQDKLTLMENFLDILSHAKQFKKAEFYVKEIKRLVTKTPSNDAISIMTAYDYLAGYYVLTGQTKLAYFYTDGYSAFVNKRHLVHGIRTTEKYYYQLDSIKGNFKLAMQHYLVAQKIKDSLENVTKDYQISILQIENETEKKNNDINALTRQAQIKDSELRREQLAQKLIIAGSVLLLIITGLIYSRYRLKQRSNALLIQQKSEIDKQNIALQHLIDEKNQLIVDKDELLHEKDLLLKEVNHRVKNNLQIVMSLLESQSGFMQNKKAQEAISESQNRVQSIALIHDQLFNTDKIAEIDLMSYIMDLVKSLDYSINKGNHKVKIDCYVDNILLDVAQAIPVGIILNESVTNALKYAFPEDRNGKIVVMVKKVGPNIEMQISDDGVGLPDDFSLVITNSLGITLIKGLTKQLKGSFDIKDNSGVVITIKFPVEIAATSGAAA